MILLLEGCQRTGKSTLARMLSQDLKWPILHFGVPPSEGVCQHFLAEIETEVSRHPHLIVDRFHLSNLAFHGILGGGVLQPAEAVKLDNYLARLGTWLMLMVDDPFAIEKRLQQFGERGDGAHSLDRALLTEIQKEFEKLMQFSEIARKATYSLSLYVNERGAATEEYFQLLGRLRMAAEEMGPNRARIGQSE